jgi:hypothetical protein
MTAGERGCAVSPRLGVKTPKSRDEIGKGGEQFYTA